MIEIALALSLHLGLGGDYNGIHPHIRYNHDNHIAGVYYNSESAVSTYVGHRWEYNDFGLEVGAVTGYSAGNVIPYGRATYKNVFVSPALDGHDNGLVVGYEIKW